MRTPKKKSQQRELGKDKWYNQMGQVGTSWSTWDKWDKEKGSSDLSGTSGTRKSLSSDLCGTSGTRTRPCQGVCRGYRDSLLETAQEAVTIACNRVHR